MVGFLFGSLGLASAGALPDSVQDVAHDVLDRVGVDVPPGHDRFNDPAECPGGPYKNHGDFVKQNKGDNASSAAQSDCGKPLVSTESGSDGTDSSESGDNSDEQGPNSDRTNSSGGNTDKSDNSTRSSAADDRSSTGNGQSSDHVPPEKGKPGDPSSRSPESGSAGS